MLLNLVEEFCIVGWILLLEVSHNFYSKIILTAGLQPLPCYCFKVCSNYFVLVASRFCTIKPLQLDYISVGPVI